MYLEIIAPKLLSAASLNRWSPQMEALCYFASSSSSSSSSTIPKSSFSTYSNGCSSIRPPQLVCFKKPHSPEPTIHSSSTFLYQNFIQFALEQTKSYTPLLPSPLQNQYTSLISMDGNTEIEMSSFQSTKLRLLRNLSIKGRKSEGRGGGGGVQVLDFAVFPKPEYDLPIFCANFFSVADTNIVVLDLNPLYNVINEDAYKEKYYKDLIHLGKKYGDLLPWGGKLTSESLQFFSPIVIWTRFSSSQENYDSLFLAFKDYYKAFLELMHGAEEESDVSRIRRNREAQHKYLTWRTEKDPGHGMLCRLVGESMAKEVIRGFLFNGVVDMGNGTFGEYFPEYKREDGSISEKRSMVGKSYEKRPWNANGEFVGDDMDSTS